MSSREARKLLFRTENGDELVHFSFDLKQPASELYALARKCLKDPSVEIALLTPTGDVIPEYGKDTSYKSGATPILVEDHISVDRLMRHAYKNGTSFVKVPMRQQFSLSAAPSHYSLPYWH